MTITRAFAMALLCVGFALPSAAQSKVTTAPPSSQGTTGTAGTPSHTPGSAGGQRGRREPCWQQAGIPQSVIQQRHQIEQNTRSQIESVCQDSSLSQEQKQEKIRQLREQSRSQMEGLVNAQQKQALEACRAQRAGGRGERGEGGERGGHAGKRGGGGNGPCGEAMQHSGRKPAQGQDDSESDRN